MALTLILSIEYEQPPDMSARKFSDITKRANQSVAKLWENKILPLHFEGYAGGKYGYEKRHPSTLARKKKLAKRGKVKKGGRVALVHSGNLEAQMGRPGVLRVFPRRFTLIKPAGPYITARPRGNRPNMVAEILTVLPSEDRRLTEAYDKSATRQLTRYRARRKKTTT